MAQYLAYISRPYSKYISVAEFERRTGTNVSSNPEWEKQCQNVFEIANSRRQVGEYLTAAFPTPPAEQVSEANIHLMGRGACVIPLTADNRAALQQYLNGEEGQISTNRGPLPTSVVQNSMGLRRTLDNACEQHMLFNGF